MIISFRHDQQRVLRRRKFLGAFFFVALVMFLVRVPLANILGGFLAATGAPLWETKEFVSNGAGNIRTLFSSKIALEEENTRLKEELAAVASGALSRLALREENALLKEKLSRPMEYQPLLARVLSAPASSPYDTFVVDVGSRDGVREGMEVFGDGDFVIGTITRTWKESSLVTLYSAPGAEISVSIGTSSVPALAHGVGGGNFRILLPKGLSIKEGDLIEMPALSPHYVGTVGGVLRPEGSSLQVIYTAFPFNIYHQKWVVIALPSLPVVSQEGTVLSEEAL